VGAVRDLPEVSVDPGFVSPFIPLEPFPGMLEVSDPAEPPGAVMPPGALIPDPLVPESVPLEPLPIPPPEPIPLPPAAPPPAPPAPPPCAKTGLVARHSDSPAAATTFT